jgi:ABC-type polysaccharide/polyol phosphate transport system ATPase subunit
MEVIKLQHVTKEYNVFSSPRSRFAYSLTRMKKYRPRIYRAVDDVSFTIEKGEILGILGRNGAGKSTLLKMITGVAFQTFGEISVKGRISSLLELGAGFNMELTGMDNIFFQGALLGISKEEMSTRVQAILDFADIGDYIYQPVKNYSSGMFARLAFATAIHVDPDVLIVDEVLAVGDIAFQFKCIEKMKEFAAQGVTIIFVTHNMMSLYRFCTRAIWIDKGRVVMDGTVEDVVPRYEDNLRMSDEATTLTTMQAEDASHELFKLGDVAIVPSNGARELHVHGDFTLHIGYTLNKTLAEAPYFALSFVKEGLSYDMFGIFPSQDRYTLAREAGTYNLAITFNDSPLNVGLYTVYFSVSEQNGISQIYSSSIGTLNIEGSMPSLGLVDIAHHVVLTKDKK